jgi:hypothetical protein
MKTPKKRKDGEWFPIGKNGHRIVCCNCGLDHVIRIRITEKGRVYMAAWRVDGLDNRPRSITGKE